MTPRTSIGFLVVLESLHAMLIRARVRETVTGACVHEYLPIQAGFVQRRSKGPDMIFGLKRGDVSIVQYMQYYLYRYQYFSPVYRQLRPLRSLSEIVGVPPFASQKTLLQLWGRTGCG